MSGSAFTCYWDESGTDPGTNSISKSHREIFLVAGYLAHVDEWDSLEERWNPILDDYGLREKGFHMADFCNRRYPYSKLEGRRYDALIDSLLDLVRDFPRMYVSWSLNTNDYMSVIKAPISLMRILCALTIFSEEGVFS